MSYATSETGLQPATNSAAKTNEANAKNSTMGNQTASQSCHEGQASTNLVDIPETNNEILDLLYPSN